jgi:hypothetical protein
MRFEGVGGKNFGPGGIRLHRRLAQRHRFVNHERATGQQQRRPTGHQHDGRQLLANGQMAKSHETCLCPKLIFGRAGCWKSAYRTTVPKPQTMSYTKLIQKIRNRETEAALSATRCGGIIHCHSAKSG